MKIAILDDWLDTLRTLPCFVKLAGHEVTVWSDHVADEDELARRLADTEVLVLIRERTAITARLIARLPKLRLISLRGRFPHIDIDACTRHGVMVCANLSSYAPSYGTAELTWALILMAVRRLTENMASMRAGDWQSAVGSNLNGKTLGIYGFGRIGEIVAGYGRAFGMNVLVLSGETSSKRAVASGYALADKASLMSRSDVVTLHLRLHAPTRGIVSASDLALMKPSALLVNTSRAGLVAPGALAEALAAGRPGWAALDVFDKEPCTPTNEPLLRLPNVTATPHLGYVTRDELQAQFADVFDQVGAFADGRPIHAANPEVLRKRGRGQIS